MWPSVLDNDPYARSGVDERTKHEALAVDRGEKLAVNMWLHLYDFQTAHAAGCSDDDLAVE